MNDRRPQINKPLIGSFFVFGDSPNSSTKYKKYFFKKGKKFKKKKKNPNNSYINFLIIAKIIIQEYKLVLRYFILWAGD